MQIGRKPSIAALCLVVSAALAAPADAMTIYVSNEKGNSVTVIDGETMEVSATVDVGNRPRGIALSKDFRFLYICASDDDHIEILDTESLKVVGTLPSGPDPELMVISPDGKRLYVANEDDNLVTVVDLESGQAIAEVPVGVEPEGMGVSPDGKIIVNTSETTNMAHFIDADSFQITGNVLVDQRPRFAEFTSDGEEVWVSSEIGGTVSVIDTKTREIVHKIGFSSIPGVRPEAIQPVGARVLSVMASSKAFVALGPGQPRGGDRCPDLRSRRSIVLVGQRVWQLALSPDEKQLFSSNGVSNDISLIDVKRGKARKSIPDRQLSLGHRNQAVTSTS